MLWEIVSSLKTFICSIESVVSKEQNSIKFFKKGSYIKGTLHQRADWILVADLDKKYKFPFHIPYTELQPEFGLF